jgi:phosphatidylinositol-3,4,5-trisphosphate 3-phosphatase/dual-specificity protein phosphatase PTEN
MAQLLQNKVRALVSKKKHRMREDGFDLDLTYVTPRIIAMGIPSVDYQKVYRNRIEDVERFLETRHGDNYRVYNLCSEMRNTYAMTRFCGRFERFPFDDHSPPPLGLLYYFCESAHEWLSQSKENVIAVHCKAGKGRTGTCISAYFLYARLYRTPSEAMAAYGNARTKNRKGVTIPSQRRFVEYFGHCCERRHVVDLDSVYTTHRFRDEEIGNRGWGAPCEQLLDQAWNARWRRQATDCPAPPRRVLMLTGVRSAVGLVDVYCGGCIYSGLGGRLTKMVPLTEEVHVSIKDKKKGYGFWFHCSFVEGSMLRITKHEMDKAWKDKGFLEDASIELIFEPVRTR